MNTEKWPQGKWKFESGKSGASDNADTSGYSADHGKSNDSGESGDSGKTVDFGKSTDSDKSGKMKNYLRIRYQKPDAKICKWE